MTAFKKIILFLITCFYSALIGQINYKISGKIIDSKNIPLEFASIQISPLNKNTFSKENGTFSLEDLPEGTYTLSVVLVGYDLVQKTLRIPQDSKTKLNIKLLAADKTLEEIVVTGNFRETGKDDSPIAIDIINSTLFQKTNTPTLMEATSLVNGVRPQLNCNVCNTGDIHINGMEGPYTLVLIDGMPIVSGLSSVYGLSGIPMGMIERLEIAKGPSSSLYGSEAMGGTINVITKKITTAPKVYVDYSLTSYLENNLDVSTKFKIGKKINYLIGVNGFWFDKKFDINNDGFTDVTLQKRISLFNKLNIERKNDKEFSIGYRLIYEDRWGGQTNWNKNFRGGDSVYGESIYTKRGELISKYEWPTKEKITTQISYNFHDQNSYYGTTPFFAKQSTAFFQTYWDKKINTNNTLLLGTSLRNNWYDDNTIVTAIDSTTNNPEKSNVLGVFTQYESILDTYSKHHLLLGARLDYHPIYKFIPSPRIAYKWAPNYRTIVRLNLGSGFRIVNVFTEDHASLTGARDVVFIEKIKPETSYNGSVNFIYKMPFVKNTLINWDINLFYYYFTNKIIANYDLNPNLVVYTNLNGYAFTRGASVNANFISKGNFKCGLGFTYTDVQNINQIGGANISSWQINTPKYSGNIIMGYVFPKFGLKLDLTGTYTGPQRLPILPNDYRPETSPWFSLINFQLTKEIKNKLDLYLGVKNILNFIPQNPIMRPQDPFDKYSNDPINNPHGYTFDPSYNYAPIQGIKGYFGIRLNLN